MLPKLPSRLEVEAAVLAAAREVAAAVRQAAACAQAGAQRRPRAAAAAE